MKILLFVALAILCVIGFLYVTRARPEPRGTPSPPPDGMAVAQACAVLGLNEDSIDRQAVIAAHRRLMQRVHPDKGGSALLAQQLNEAKRVLLARL